MKHIFPRSWHEAAYRLALHRRLLILLFGAVLVTHFATGTKFDVLCAATLGFCVISTLLFPSGWIETLGAVVATLATMILSGDLFGWAPTIVWPAAFFVAIQGIWVLHRFVPAGRVTIRGRRVFDHPPQQVLNAAAYLPDRRVGRRVSGPVQENGFFPVWLGMRVIDLENWQGPTSKTIDDTPDCWARIVTQTPTEIVQQIVFGELTNGATRLPASGIMSRASVEPLPDGRTALIQEEVNDTMDVVTYAGQWLCDNAWDYTTSLKAQLDGTTDTSPAVIDLDQHTLISVVLQLFAGSKPASG